MHFLRGVEFRQMFENFYKWLAPGGILVVSCIYRIPNDIYTTKYMSINNSDWPGEKIYKNDADTTFTRMLPEFAHFISPNILIREAIRAGFEIYKGFVLCVCYSFSVSYI